MSGPEIVEPPHESVWRDVVGRCPGCGAIVRGRLAIEAEARAAAVAPLEKALREFLDTVSAAEALGWTWAGTKSMKAHHPITGDLYTAHARLAALLSAPSPVREPVTLEPPPVTVASGVIEKVLPVREPEGLGYAGHDGLPPHRHDGGDSITWLVAGATADQRRWPRTPHRHGASTSPVREPEGLRVVGHKEWQFVHDEGSREALRELRAFAVQRGNVVFMVAEARSQWETLIEWVDRRLAATPERPADEALP